MSSEACCKIGAIVSSRELTAPTASGDVDEYLVTRWLGRGNYSETGVRTLADWLNKRLLREVYTAQGRSVTDTRIESEYETLAAGDESEMVDILSDLRADSIDGEGLVDEFVSKSTMRRHLIHCLGIEKSANTTDGRESNWEVEKIEYARNTVRSSVDDSLRSLDNKNRLPGASRADVTLPVLLSCPDCSIRVRLEDALDRGYVCAEHLGTSTSE